MRVVVLTGIRRGAASACLPLLAARPEIDVAMVVVSENVAAGRGRRLRRDLRKIRRIGVLGALVGLYLRTWNPEPPVPDVEEVARGLGIPVETTPRFGCERTRELVRRSGAELGLVLGAPILGPSLFEIPRHGMLNVHGDVLPRFRGGMSVVWPIYEGVREAGFTIHQIDRGIDTGPILHIERFPIRFEKTLKQTYRTNVAEIQRRVPQALADLVARYESVQPRVQTDSGGTTYTTPTLRQFLRALSQHRRLRRDLEPR